jgi:hypothetical protein
LLPSWDPSGTSGLVDWSGGGFKQPLTTSRQSDRRLKYPFARGVLPGRNCQLGGMGSSVNNAEQGSQAGWEGVDAAGGTPLTISKPPDAMWDSLEIR